MNHSMINSMVSMNGLQQKLDIIANNMANVNTSGYKRKEATFEDILYNIKQQPQSFQREGRLSPLGFNQGWGAKLSQVTTSFMQGALKDTGNPNDLAIEGDGLFEVALVNQDAAGNPVTNYLYTRDGSFDLTVLPGDDQNVYLSTADGHLVMGVDRRPISIPKNEKFVVRSDGAVFSYKGSKPEEGSELRGQLGIVRILRPQFLQQVGDNLYTIPAGIGNRQDVLQPVAQGSNLEQPITVRQGYLEQSNVDMASEMTELMMVQRAFQMSSRALTSSDTMMNLANNLRT